MIARELAEYTDDMNKLNRLLNSDSAELNKESVMYGAYMMRSEMINEFNNVLGDLIEAGILKEFIVDSFGRYRSIDSFNKEESVDVDEYLRAESKFAQIISECNNANNSNLIKLILNVHDGAIYIKNRIPESGEINIPGIDKWAKNADKLATRLSKTKNFGCEAESVETALNKVKDVIVYCKGDIDTINNQLVSGSHKPGRAVTIRLVTNICGIKDDVRLILENLVSFKDSIENKCSITYRDLTDEDVKENWDKVLSRLKSCNNLSNLERVLSFVDFKRIVEDTDYIIEVTSKMMGIIESKCTELSIQEIKKMLTVVQSINRTCKGFIDNTPVDARPSLQQSGHIKHGLELLQDFLIEPILEFREK